MKKLIGRDALDPQRIIKLHKAPLYSVDGFSLGDGRIDIVGLVLSPGGEPNRVRIEVDDGVQFLWEYPLPTPDADEYYWYWPNASYSGYRLTIDLPASTDESNAYRVRFRFDTPEIKLACYKDTFYVPKDLSCYQNFPGQSNLSRVQFFDNINGVTVRGYSDYRRLRALSEYYGLDLSTARILDWGCGHGRVIRHFMEIGPSVDLHGVDIDAENATWADSKLKKVTTIHGPLMPPLPYDADMFNMIFGISVMTHLSANVQKAWLQELRRITAPGGLVFLTFSGDTDVAFTSRMLSQQYIDHYVNNGRGHDLPSGDLIGKIEDASYYKNVKVSAPSVRSLCASYFEVLDVLECMFGYQDLAVLRCP